MLQKIYYNQSFYFPQRLFVVPAYTEEQEEIPFGRVNHNKYMVTDNTAYIGKYCYSTSVYKWNSYFWSTVPYNDGCKKTTCGHSVTADLHHLQCY